MHYQIMFVVTSKIKCTELQPFENCIPEYYIETAFKNMYDLIRD